MVTKALAIIKTWKWDTSHLVQTIELGVQRGPSCRNTNILQIRALKESLRRSLFSCGMSTYTLRLTQAMCLIGRRDSLDHPMRHSLFGDDSFFVFIAKTHKQLFRSTPLGCRHRSLMSSLDRDQEAAHHSQSLSQEKTKPLGPLAGNEKVSKQP